VADRYDVSDGVLQARGGRNGSTLEGPQYVDGGAGTIYVLRPDATDGELLVSSRDSRYPASTHRAAGTPLAGTLAFDTITIGPRALARFDAEASGTRTVDPSAFVVTPADLPTVTLVSTAPSAGADVPQATSIVARITAASAAGIREVRTIVDKQPTDVVAYTRFVTTVPETASTIAVPATATTGAASLIVRVTDRAGRVAQSAPIAFNVVTNVAPVIDAMNVTPASETYAGRAITVSAAASDDVEVTSLALTSSAGTVTAQAAVKPTAKTMTREFSVSVPPATPSGTDVVLTLTAGDGFPNRAATTRTHNLRILKDSVAPSLAIVQPVANQELQEGTGATFVVEVNTSDAEVAVKDVKVTLDGVVSQLAFVSGTTWRATLAVPNVDGSTPVAKTLTIDARDYEANVTTSTLTVFVKPLIDPNAPLLSWVCASPGAMAPAGYETAIRVSAVPASSTNGVSSVAITVGGTPLTVTSAGTNLYEGKFVMPIGTPDGTVLDVRVTARSVSNNDASLIGTLTAVAGTEVSTASFIAADDTAFENGTVIVRSGGTLTIAGAHHLRNVVVLPGGTLVQQHADLLRADLLTVDRLYVGCGAAIDVSALGYRKNVTAPGTGSTDLQAGGGHVGRGGVWKRASGSSFGSLTRPREAGAGGWASLTSGALASAGGGVVRMHATASMTIDGAVRANASSTNGGGGGAGGSVWLTTAGPLVGAGTIDALGGETNATGGGGSGGAIAIEYGSTSGALLNNVRARGAANVRDGGSGSIYLRGAGAIDGELILDNTGRTTSPGLSELPSFGRAIAASVNGNTIALAGRRWLGPWFEGHRVRVIAPDGTVRGTYRIGTIANDAQATPVNGYAEVKTQDAVAYDGYIVYSPLGINGRNFVAARWANDRWEYDTDSIFTAFNPRSGEGIVASFTKDAVAITALSTFSCEGGCPAAIHGLPVLELAAGEIAANAISGDAAGSPENLGHLDDAEFLVRPDAQGRSILISRGVDATVTLIGDDGSAVNVAPGDALQGLYRFDKIKVVSATVVTNDLLETATAPVLDATSSLAVANPTTPLLGAAHVSIERGLNGPVLVGPAGAVSDGESAVDVIARNATRTTPTLATPSWNRAWLVFPGTRGGLSLATRPTDSASPFGISSFETITGSGYLSFTPSQTNLAIQAGLAPSDTTRALTEPSFYGFRLGSNGRYDVYANAVNANKNAVYTTASVFRLEVTRQRIRWFVDGVRVHEVTASIPPSLRLDVSSTAEGAELHSIEYDVTTDGGRARAAAAANGSFRLPLRGAA
ncbi:MAG TPA: hypothetical protein VE010_21745, partial [Thermoanaerobaculia bacterium]|nr:hypothetical protein [Thermoanaerobaculia bacterium]